jgi:hypothetical protein
MDKHSVGNRMADYQANLARLKSDCTFPLGLQQLPLERCEHHLLVKSSDGLVVIDDLRRTGKLLLKSRARAKWTAKSDLQGRFAGEGIMDLGRVILRLGSPTEQVTLVHVATNSIHYQLITHDDGSKALEQLQCALCTVSLTLDHLASCPDAPCVDFRHQLHTDIIDLFIGFDECDGWCRVNGRLDLSRLLLSLFPPSASASVEEDLVSDHTARCLIGAFTQAECMAAIRSLRIKDLKDGRSAFHQLRLLCLDHIEKLYSKLKMCV